MSLTCKKCGTAAIKNFALCKEFWYCKQCKVEVMEDADPTLNMQAEIDKVNADIRRRYENLPSVHINLIEHWGAHLESIYGRAGMPDFVDREQLERKLSDSELLGE